MKQLSAKIVKVKRGSKHTKSRSKKKQKLSATVIFKFELKLTGIRRKALHTIAMNKKQTVSDRNNKGKLAFAFR